MKITFVGATHEVTGSCYFLEAAGKKFLVDCGMEQGPDNFENIPIPVPASELDFVLLTHAHIDHSGKLPVLYAEGFRGNIYTAEWASRWKIAAGISCFPHAPGAQIRRMNGLRKPARACGVPPAIFSTAGNAYRLGPVASRPPFPAGIGRVG